MIKLWQPDIDRELAMYGTYIQLGLGYITLRTRSQPATIIPRPARVIEIVQGASFPERPHHVLQ